MTLQSFIFIGRYGAGKGTQAKLLLEVLAKKDPAHGTVYVETGAEFRKFGQEKSFTAQLTKKCIDQGLLMPEYMCVYVWNRCLVDKYTGNEHIVFDGTPRKLLEAQALESLFPFYNLPKPYIIYLDVHHEESIQRLKIRNQGRADDTAEAIERRKAAYEADVVPTIEWYRKNSNVIFLDIDGVRPIDEIHQDIVKRVGL
ncbi:MAG: nucleoside monophosphate kinase [Patescibacteria group bacterium]|nr:nucleoside monophosphate kinase [Patescibacteria group bacterium]